MGLPSVRTTMAFASAARRYWFGVFPVVQREVYRLRCCARSIPDPALRSLALDAQRRKWACLEGAAAFATFVAPKQRVGLARLLVDIQALLDYVDTLMEQPSEDPAANARQLHQAFLAALQPDMPHDDYYKYHPRRDDGGYLLQLAAVCRSSIRKLPSYSVVADAVMLHAGRMVFYQSNINLATTTDHPRLMQWAGRQVLGNELNWWEIGAACGSSLAIFAHLAAATDPTLTPYEVAMVDTLYWPWAEALHILLDSLIDRDEDRATEQPNLLDHYSTREEMTDRLGLLASETTVRVLDVLPYHRLILAGMVALYLSDEQAWTAFAEPAAKRILAATGTLANPAMLLFSARRLAPKAGRPAFGPPTGR